MPAGDNLRAAPPTENAALVAPMSTDQADSPCVNFCRIDEVTGWCRGCRRTIKEIMGWEQASEEERRVVIADLANRHLPAVLGDE